MGGRARRRFARARRVPRASLRRHLAWFALGMLTAAVLLTRFVEGRRREARERARAHEQPRGAAPPAAAADAWDAGDAGDTAHH